MKRFLALAFALVMAISLAVPMLAETDITYEDESPVVISVPKIEPGLIAIDGKKDDAYNVTSAIPVEEQNLDDWAQWGSMGDTSGKIWVVWDGSYVYTYAECVDPELLTIHGGDNETYGPLFKGDHLGIIIDWDYNREFISYDHKYSYDDYSDNISYINFAADGGKDFFQTYHLLQDGMSYFEQVSTYAYYDADAGIIYYECQIPVPYTEVEITDGMKVGYEVGFTNANSIGYNRNPNDPRVGNVTLSPHGNKMWRWTNVCATAILLGAEEIDEPTDPVDPVDPAEPTDPVSPAEPTDPVDPVEPDEPSAPDVPDLPGLDPVDDPSGEHTDAPADDPEDDPADDPADAPTDDPADDPAEDPADEPVDDPADPVDDPVDDPADNPADDPSEPADTDVTEEPSKLGTHAIIGIVVVVAAVIAVVVALVSKKKK